VTFTGTPYGAYSVNQRNETGILLKIKELFTKISRALNPDLLQDNLPEKKAWTQYSISRIAVFSEGAKNKRLLMNTWDTKKAIKFKSIEKRLNPLSRKRQLKHFHKDVAKKEFNMICEECHSAESLLDYKDLGFSSLKTDKLKKLNIKGMVSHYDVFYIPQILQIGK